MADIQTAANSPAAQWPRRRTANGAPQTAAKTGSQAGRAPVSAALSALQARHDFATGLIAAKSINTCDGGVFRGVEFAPENGALCAPLRAVSPLRRGLRAAIPQAARHLPVGTKSAARNAARNAAADAAKTGSQAGCAPLFAALSALQARHSFATDLIAAKSINTCDGGVFRGAEFAPENGAKYAGLRLGGRRQAGSRSARCP